MTTKTPKWDCILYSVWYFIFGNYKKNTKEEIVSYLTTIYNWSLINLLVSCWLYLKSQLRNVYVVPLKTLEHESEAEVCPALCLLALREHPFSLPQACSAQRVHLRHPSHQLLRGRWVVTSSLSALKLLRNTSVGRPPIWVGAGFEHLQTPLK